MFMIQNISALENYLISQIPEDFKKKYTGSWGLDKVKEFLKSVDNPQEKQPVIHISGTSGKGSSSYFTANLLVKQGFKVGLHVSPYVIDFTESFLINNQLPDQKELLFYFNQFVLEYQKFGQKITYFELKVCFAFYFFNSVKVDFIVIETGMGGTFDTTNVINNPNKICLINQIGYDHQEVLGSSIKQIADQESGIINPYNTVIYINQKYKISQQIITKKSKQNHAKLYQVNFNSKYNNSIKPNIFNIVSSQNGTQFDYQFDGYSYPNLKTSMLGDFQAKNAVLALTGIILASDLYNFELDTNAIYQAILETTFPARMQIVTTKNKQKIIVDGAHNPQKIEALVCNLKAIFKDQKFTVLCGFSGNRNPKPMLKKIAEIADKIILTQFSNQGLKIVGKSSVQNNILIKNLNQLKFKNYQYFEDLDMALKTLENSPNQSKLVTGSFYLCGEILKKI